MWQVAERLLMAERLNSPWYIFYWNYLNIFVEIYPLDTHKRFSNPVDSVIQTFVEKISQPFFKFKAEKTLKVMPFSLPCLSWSIFVLMSLSTSLSKSFYMLFFRPINYSKFMTSASWAYVLIFFDCLMLLFHKTDENFHLQFQIFSIERKFTMCIMNYELWKQILTGR